MYRNIRLRYAGRPVRAETDAAPCQLSGGTLLSASGIGTQFLGIGHDPFYLLLFLRNRQPGTDTPDFHHTKRKTRICTRRIEYRHIRREYARISAGRIDCSLLRLYRSLFHMRRNLSRQCITGTYLRKRRFQCQTDEKDAQQIAVQVQGCRNACRYMAPCPVPDSRHLEPSGTALYGNAGGKSAS